VVRRDWEAGGLGGEGGPWGLRALGYRSSRVEIFRDERLQGFRQIHAEP
jgi:hypothetical protein